MTSSERYLPSVGVEVRIRRMKGCAHIMGHRTSFFSTNSHLYHYAGNNPVRYVDPEGWFDVDDELKTIAADLDDKQDMSAAARAFFILQNYGYICMAKESNQGQSITFTNARSMYSFLDGTYEEYELLSIVVDENFTQFKQRSIIPRQRIPFPPVQA